MQQMIFIADYAHHQELESIIKVVAACGILVVWFSSCRYGVELRVVCPVCGLSKAEWRRCSSASCLTGKKKLDDSSRLDVDEIARVA